MLVFRILVEAGGIEPPSESASSGTSPGAESHLHSLTRAWAHTLTGLVASLCMVRSKLCALTFAANQRPAAGPRPSRRGRSLLRQREEQAYRCSLIYRCPFYGCQAHPPAIPVSAPPSKPVRPLVGADCISLASPQAGKLGHSVAPPLKLKAGGFQFVALGDFRKVRSTFVSAVRLCLLAKTAFAPLRLLSKPNPRCWASVL